MRRLQHVRVSVAGVNLMGLTLAGSPDLLIITLSIMWGDKKFLHLSNKHLGRSKVTSRIFPRRNPLTTNYYSPSLNLLRFNAAPGSKV